MRMSDWLHANGSTGGQPGTVLYAVYFNVPGYPDSLYTLFPEGREPGNTTASARYAALW